MLCDPKPATQPLSASLLPRRKAWGQISLQAPGSVSQKFPPNCGHVYPPSNNGIQHRF